MVYWNGGYFGVKSKVYDATMERAEKESPLEIRDISRNKKLISKRVKRKQVYAVTKKILKAGEVLVTTVKKSASEDVVYRFLWFRCKKSFLMIQ